jgi:hypothetical protein
MSTTKFQRRKVAADLVEATPGMFGHWLLASPILLFLGWVWLDLFNHFSPIPWRWLDGMLGVAAYIFFLVLPLGVAAHYLVTSFPRIFQNTGWDVQPLELVREAEQYTVRYIPRRRIRAAATWSRLVLRAGQGWVYLEILAIFVGAAVMIPLFFSVTEYGFGR